MHVSIGRSAVLIAFVTAFAIYAYAQTAGPTLGGILDGAGEQRKAYINEFRNLLSQETKSFEIYDKKDGVKKKRSVVSTFIVYQLSNDPNNIAEYRNVVSVDGKKLNDADKRAQDFFEEIVKVDSSAKELDKLDREGSRYDQDISLNGLTLYQSVALAENLRPYFDFKLNGREKLGDRDVFVVSYQQSRSSPYIATDPAARSTDGKLNLVYDVDFEGSRAVNGRLRGTFWIDAETFQVWKEVRTLTIRPDGFTAPAAFAENTFEYEQSHFGILTPRKITYTEYKMDKKTHEGRKAVVVTFLYSDFTKPDVEVKSGEVKH